MILSLSAVFAGSVYVLRVEPSFKLQDFRIINT